MLLIGLMISGFSSDRSALAHHPGSPFVLNMTRPAAKYLEGNSSSSELGGECIIALALYKADRPVSHPKIQQAIKTVRSQTGGQSFASERTMYSTAIACIFLCEVDPEGSKASIKKLLEAIYDRQAAHGAWTYPGTMQGDTSQTQYCCLALWEARKNGFDVPPKVGVAALNWLLATQSSDGGFAYQPLLFGDGGRVKRNVYPSMCAAGLGSVYITADWLGYGATEVTVRRPEEKGLPKDVHLVVERKVPTIGKKLAPINESGLKQAQTQGNAWFKRNFKAKVTVWPYYFLYGYERYASFREKAEGRNDPEPEWYNKGAEFLKETQLVEGCWEGTNGSVGAGRAVETAFALLFLLRGTKKSLNADFQVQSGVLKGGAALPDEGRLSLRGGRVQAQAITKSVDDLLAMVDSADDHTLDAFVASLKSLKFEGEAGGSKTQQMAVLQSLIKHKKYQLRLVAVRHIGQMRKLDHVPILLFALSDPNWQVAREANVALRSISRKFDDNKLSDNPDEGERDTLIKKWTEWYKSINPGGDVF